MAARAESDHIIFQKIFRFGGTMWIMAVNTAFLYRIVLEFCFCNGLSNILVTIKTEIVPRFEKDELILRCVGIMAFYTIAFHHNFMTAFGILGYNSFMALIAYFVRIFGE
jgi:hypothetical protein